MAFPTIQSIETRQIASSTTHDIVLPAGIVSGELVLIFHSNSGAQPTYPAGWNATPMRELGFCYGALLYAVADGTTAGSTVSITLASARAGCAQIIRVLGWEGTIGSGLTVGTVNPASDTLDPVAVTASWGSDDNLFICAIVAGDDDVAVTGYPTNYTQGAYVNTGAGSNLGAEIATAYRELAAATDDPGAFTLASSESQGAVALVVRPGTAGGGGSTFSSVPATAFPGQSRTVTGTGFGATQGTGGLTIGGVSQTITSWSDTSITFTTVQGNNKYEAGKTLEVTTDAATTVSDTIEIVADTANGFGYVDMSSPNTTDESSVAFGATPTVVTGDQFEWEDFNNLGNLTVDAQGFVTNVDTEGTFRGRFWDATDSTWGAVETFNATIPESAPAFAPDVGIISKTDTTGTIPFSYIGGDADSFEHSTDGGATWNTVTSPISRTGLTAETTYSGLIRAVNTGGNGPTASYSFTTNAVGVVDNWPFGKGINPTATKNWEWGKRHPKTGMRVRVYK